MKINIKKILTQVSILTLTFIVVACSSTTGPTAKVNDEGELKKAIINLKKGKVYELTYASLKKGGMKVLKNKYFPKAMPIVGEYGGKMLGMFKVVANTGGKMKTPQVIALFEWESIKQMKNLHNDSRMGPLGKIRDGQIIFFRQSYYSVKQDKEITFRSDKTYEFFNAWLRPNEQDSLDKYFVVSLDAKKRHGPPIFRASLSPFKTSLQGKHILKPHMAGIVEWPDTQTYYDLIKDEEFATKAQPLLDRAVYRLDMLHTKFVF
ncbi:hypothetical protein A9Q84_14800 [Halobacteriovorax marinus]|uniref:Lipoprotein n=1 Tax=Halobacteriovorax marinus TaxID=97084 RepID=A0A1Y5F5C9_9BACT|nr:hypothetical protein A9Q84_14800 [Halobacteriovorax marinus]